MERPILSKQLDQTTFRSFYYRKEELVDFCRMNGLPTSGGKIEITDRIAYFLETGKIIEKARSMKEGTKKLEAKAKEANRITGDILEDTRIEPNFVCSEKHRVFFKEHIGKSFTFNVAFQKWLKRIQGKHIAMPLWHISRFYRRRKMEKQPLIRNLNITPIFEISLQITMESIMRNEH